MRWMLVDLPNGASEHLRVKNVLVRSRVRARGETAPGPEGPRHVHP